MLAERKKRRSQRKWGLPSTCPRRYPVATPKVPHGSATAPHHGSRKAGKYAPVLTRYSCKTSIQDSDSGLFPRSISRRHGGTISKRKNVVGHTVGVPCATCGSR